MGKAGRKLSGAALAEWNVKHPRGADGRYIKAGGTGSLPGLVASGRARARLGITAPASSLRQPRTPVPAPAPPPAASPRTSAAGKLKKPKVATSVPAQQDGNPLAGLIEMTMRKLDALEAEMGDWGKGNTPAEVEHRVQRAKTMQAAEAELAGMNLRALRKFSDDIRRGHITDGMTAKEARTHLAIVVRGHHPRREVQPVATPVPKPASAGASRKRFAATAATTKAPRPEPSTKTPADHAAHLRQVRTRQEAADYVAEMKGDEAKAVLKEMGATYIPRLPKDVKQQIVAWVGSRLTTDAILNSRADRPQPEVRAAAARLGAATAPAPRRGLRVQTWEELGKPSGPPPVGQRIGHEGGTYELLPGTPRRYRVIADDGRDISGQVVTGRGSQTADDARTALRMAAYDRQQRDASIASGTVDAWDAVPGSWSYDGTVGGFDRATPAEREQIRQALHRWATHGGNSREDASRMAEPPVNRALRGVMPHNDETRADVAALDRAFELSRAKRKITVYRGVSDGTHILPDDWQSRDLTGVQWGGNGYTPVTGNLAAAESYTGRVEDRGFAIRMNLPKGAKAIAIRDAPGAADDEGEIVLPRELTFRVVKDNGAVGGYGIRLLDVEVVPASPASTRGTSRRRLASG